MKFIKSYKERDHKTDEELLHLFIETGDLEILGELYNRYLHLVYGVCLKYLKNNAESQDAVMQIFEKLITEIPRHQIENFRNWLHVVTKNYCLMQLRSEKSKQENLKEWLDFSGVFMESQQVLHPIDEVDHQMEKDLTDFIQKLKNEQKECIQQFYYENRCYDEIASNLGMDKKKVKSHLQNAKRNLKICLEEKHVRQKQEY